MGGYNGQWIYPGTQSKHFQQQMGEVNGEVTGITDK